MDEHEDDDPLDVAADRRGRPASPHLINWRARAETIWLRYPERRVSGPTIYERGYGSLGGFDGFRKKFAGKRRADDGFAAALLAATEFEEVGITFADWTTDDLEWAEVVITLPAVDPLHALNVRVGATKLSMKVDSTTVRHPVRYRRAGVGEPPEHEVFINQYYRIRLQYEGSDLLPVVHIIAIEWSPTTKDWQVFNRLPDSLLNVRNGFDLRPTTQGSVAEITTGLRVAPPQGEFTLYVLAKRTPFNHQILGTISQLDDLALMTPKPMSMLLERVFNPEQDVHVAKARYAVR